MLAGDISPIDVITHVPVLCEDNDIPYVYVPSKEVRDGTHCICSWFVGVSSNGTHNSFDGLTHAASCKRESNSETNQLFDGVAKTCQSRR